MARFLIASIFCLSTFPLTGCSGSDAPVPVLNTDTSLEVAAPEPRYAEREGDTYMYVSAVSEEDQKRGMKTGDVVMFRYLGEEGGVFRLELIDDSGRRIDVSECSRPCKVVKSIAFDGSVSRIGFNEGSIIGSAFTDAFNGLLEKRATPRTRNEKKVVELDQEARTETPPESEYERLNELCRRGSGDEAATLNACEERDNLPDR